MSKKLIQIIQEEYDHLLKEYSKGDEVDWDLWEKRNEIKSNIFYDFLYDNTPNFDKHIPWRLIQYPMLKKVWEDYMRYGFLRNTKALDKIEGIMIRNTLKIDVLTELAGHSTVDPQEDFDEWFKTLVDGYIQWKLQQKNPPDKQQLQIDYEKGGGYGKQPNVQTITPSPQEKKVFDFLDRNLEDYWERLGNGQINMEDIENKAYDILENRFYDYYIEDPQSGQPYISDYGLEPLAKLVEKLRNLPEDNVGERIVTVDKMLNVVHQRSDLASWFVKGGSEALSDLSASPSERAANKLNEIIISEIGEATMNPYKWELIDQPSDYGDDYEYTFKTEDGEVYTLYALLTIDGWEITYRTNTGDYKTVTNKGNVFRVMATIVDIINDFVEKQNPKRVVIEPIKNAEDDMRRYKLYKAYIDKILPPDYNVDFNQEKILITKKTREY